MLIGGGGHARVVIDLLLELADQGLSPRPMGFLDDVVTQAIWSVPCLGAISKLHEFPEASFHIALGNNEIRSRIAKEIGHQKLITVTHPEARISRHAKIGPGCFVGVAAVVNCGASISIGSIVNSGAIIEHDACIAEFAHVSYGAIVSAGAHILPKTTVPSGTVVERNQIYGGSA
jgi:acetyltransferase EpsM